MIDWPRLDDEARNRLVSLPIWDIAVQTEGRARLNVATYAATASDPLLRKAIELNAVRGGPPQTGALESGRRLWNCPCPRTATPSVKGDPEWAFMVTGYSECIDSFFAFGFFESAKRSGFFPEALVDTFEPVIQEEGATSCSSSIGSRGIDAPCRFGGGPGSSESPRSLAVSRSGNALASPATWEAAYKTTISP